MFILYTVSSELLFKRVVILSVLLTILQLAGTGIGGETVTQELKKDRNKGEEMFRMLKVAVKEEIH